ncbi:MAG: hypothetical protein COU69_04045 [Candidatus Pacebacteria bacterium CG10_big_fil_rev_8_21_14_0_10_56_10]|nr:MAG: hypothetical protein COU69_04045 [Candidatus Pacebacteria bacterium CG10_big_fil_rev_8_21_14_0_10_56_10]
MITLREPIEFEWDKGNQNKNWNKHKITQKEAEEVFGDKHNKISKDFFHSKKEDRYLLIGKTTQGRKLFIVFTLRKNKMRVISARDLSKKEYRLLSK